MKSTPVEGRCMYAVQQKSDVKIKKSKEDPGLEP
jgi:hypothetical protein